MNAPSTCSEPGHGGKQWQHSIRGWKNSWHFCQTFFSARTQVAAKCGRVIDKDRYIHLIPTFTAKYLYSIREYNHLHLPKRFEMGKIFFTVPTEHFCIFCVVCLFAHSWILFGRCPKGYINLHIHIPDDNLIWFAKCHFPSAAVVLRVGGSTGLILFLAVVNHDNLFYGES